MEYVIRLTADCPCFDPELLDMTIDEMKDDMYYKDMMKDSFADGLALEIMIFSALIIAWTESDHSFEREHVT